MSTDFICHKKDLISIVEDEVRAIIQPFVASPLPSDLSHFMWVRLKTGDPFGFSFGDDVLYICVTRVHHTPGITAVLRALADAGFLLHYSGTEEYIDPYSDKWASDEEPPEWERP